MAEINSVSAAKRGIWSSKTPEIPPPPQFQIIVSEDVHMTTQNPEMIVSLTGKKNLELYLLDIHITIQAPDNCNKKIHEANSNDCI